MPEPCIWAGRYTPDLNGERRFLRGAPHDSEQLVLEDDSFQGTFSIKHLRSPKLDNIL